jgi:hypothetical protein
MLLSTLFFTEHGTASDVSNFYEPEPIEIPCSHLSLEQIRDEIRTAVTPRGWQTKTKGSGLMEAAYFPRKKLQPAVISIVYDAKTVKIRFKSIGAMTFSAKEDKSESDWVGGGVKYIGGYNHWIRNMERDIRTRFDMVCGEKLSPERPVTDKPEQ